MMGKSLTTLDVPVVKGTSGILIMKNRIQPGKMSLTCIRCQMCFCLPHGIGTLSAGETCHD